MSEMTVPILWTDDLCCLQLHMHEFSGKFITNIHNRKTYTNEQTDIVRGVVDASGVMAARRCHLDYQLDISRFFYIEIIG